MRWWTDWAEHCGRKRRSSCANSTEIYSRCRGGRGLTYWDFDELGLSLGGYGWSGVQIWPSPPESEHEFWLYLAHAAMEHGRKIPEFLQPVTHLEEIEGRLRSWKRRQEIERWEQTLQHAAVVDAADGRSRGMFDLRLVLGEKMAELEWKRPGQADFGPFKQVHLNQFAQDYDEGRVELPPKPSCCGRPSGCA